MKSRTFRVWTMFAIAGLVCCWATAQAQSPLGNEAPDQPQLAPEVEAMLNSPRSLVTQFLAAVNQGDLQFAANALDLRAMPAPVAEAKGADLAFKLKALLDRIARIDLTMVDDNSLAPNPYPLGEQIAIAANLTDESLQDARRIELLRDEEGHWRFSKSTVAEIEPLWMRWQDRERVEGLAVAEERPTVSVWLAQQFPARLRATRFLLPDYQWLSLLALIFIGFVADVLARFILIGATRAWFRHLRADRDVVIDAKLFRPIGLLVQALLWYGGTRLIGLPPTALLILLVGLKFFAVVAGVWTAFLLINLLSAFLSKKAERTATKFDDLLVPLVSKSLKVFVVCIGALTGADALGLPLAGLVGGTAIGGLALAMASKDAVSNFFGSVTVLVDRPFEVGDWVILDGAEGTVETVGFRSTRIRTFYNSQITVPNSLLTTAIVDNMGRRRYRRIKTTIGLQYDTTPEQIEAFCEGVRELIRRHPYTRKDYYHVYFNDFAASSLDIMLYCFVECPDWGVELRERHRLLADIMKLARSLGCQFAFPTRTLHLFQEELRGNRQEISDAARAGQHAAAQIAGPLLTGADRPGGVLFEGPSSFLGESTDVRESSPTGEDSEA
ncbi:MAG: mechanosensitive ion channel [Planctomycetales bacterium]|nr:mechanosensitive ion channel [Planctomycetales bacterium]